MHTINATSKNWNSKQKDRKHTTIHRAQPTLNGLNGREGNKKHKYTHNSVLLQQTHTRDEKKNHTERTNERTIEKKCIWIYIENEKRDDIKHYERIYSMFACIMNGFGRGKESVIKQAREEQS